jgi:hypothetical protein
MEGWKKSEEQIRKECKEEFPEFYRKKREQVEQHFVPEKAKPSKARAWVSPSGKYTLIVTPYETSKGCWNYSRGQVYLTEEYLNATLGVFSDRKGLLARLKELLYDETHQPDIKLVADVKRNYGAFPCAWIEDHADGHDYLVCGEDYQAVTIVQLDTGIAKTDVDSLSVKGWGWCHTNFYPSPNKHLLAAAGCVWAGPYDIRFYDFRKPMELPWPIIETIHDETKSTPWDKESGVFVAEKNVEIRKSDEKPTDELTEEEEEALDSDDNDDDYDYKDVSIVISQEDLMEKLEKIA